MSVNIITPGTGPAEVGVSGNTYYYTTLNFDCAVYFWPNTPGGDIGYDWDWGDGTTHATTKAASHSYTAPGTYTVTITATHVGYAPATDWKTVYAVGGNFTYNTQELRWYGGETVPYTYKADCNAAQGQPGTIDYNWGSSSGRITAEYGQSTPEAIMSAEQGGATPAGNGVGSEEMHLSYHTSRGGYYDYFRGGFTIYQPQTLVESGNPHVQSVDWDDPFWGQGYLTYIEYSLQHQFQGSMSDYPVNEAFGMWENRWQPDPPGSNWPAPDAGGFTTTGTSFADHVGYHCQRLGYTPWTAHHGNDPDPVYRRYQVWYVGSEESARGVIVGSDVQYYYIDHGEHQNFQGR